MAAVPEPDHFTQVVNLIRPLFNYGALLGFLLILSWMTGKSPLELGEKFFGQFVRLAKGERSLKSLNALIEVLAFILIVILFASPVRDFLIPEITGNDASRDALILDGIIGLIVVSFLVAGVTCVWFCSPETD